MRRTITHKLLLLSLLLLSISGIAGSVYAKQAGSSTQHTKAHQFSDATGTHGEFEISLPNTPNAAHHRTHIKNGPGPGAYTTNNTLILPNTKNLILCKQTEQVHSRHLLLIFPFHYFW